MNTDWNEKTVAISEIKDLLDQDYEIEVDSPDGWVGVTTFIDKGMWNEYILRTENGLEVICNEWHLFKTVNGWMTAKDMLDFETIYGYNMNVYTKDGLSRAFMHKTGRQVPIVDINVAHENQRYYTNGVESHNTGVGKSLMMCNLAADNLMMGLNVLYITMEMAEYEIAKRIDANILDVTMQELEDMPKDAFLSKMERVKGKTKGKLVIKEYPTSSAGAGNFRHLLNELRLKKNFAPDIVYIDYLNICASSRIKNGSNVNSYSYIKAIVEELRGLAVEFNIALVTATQTTRGGYGDSDVDITDVSESFGVAHTADFMCALITSEELENLGQLMVKQLKNRYNDINYIRRFVLGIERAKMKLFNLEESAQGDIQDDKPVFDKTSTGNKFDKEKFKGFN